MILKKQVESVGQSAVTQLKRIYIHIYLSCLTKKMLNNNLQQENTILGLIVLSNSRIETVILFLQTY